MFFRNTVTLPNTAGETKSLNIKGHGIIIEEMPLYNGTDEVPLMYFNSENNQGQPLYPQAKYVSDEKIKKVIFEATEESKGDSITFLSTPYCLEPDINVSMAFTSEPDFKQQFTIDLVGTNVETISDLQLEKDGKFPSAIYIGARDFNILFAYGINPDAKVGFWLMNQERPIKISGIRLIRDLRFRNADTGGTADATLNVLCEYN